MMLLQTLIRNSGTSASFRKSVLDKRKLVIFEQFNNFRLFLEINQRCFSSEIIKFEGIIPIKRLQFTYSLSSGPGKVKLFTIFN